MGWNLPRTFSVYFIDSEGLASLAGRRPTRKIFISSAFAVQMDGLLAGIGNP